MARLFPLHQFSKCLTATKVSNKFQIRRYKTILGDKVTELGEKTLTGRLLMYFNNFNDTQNQAKEPTPKFEQINFNALGFKHCNIDEIKSSIKYLDISHKFSKLHLLQSLDKECSKRLKHMKTTDIFEILHIFINKLPNRIIELNFYNSSLLELRNRLEYLNKNEIIQYIFYIGLRKKGNRCHEIVRECLNHLSKSGLDKLTTEDLCVICNSTFKTTTRINNEEFLSTIITYIHSNLELFKDPAFFITFLKSIRHNRYQNEDLLSTMTCTIFFNDTLKHYSFSALCHILAIYSDYLYYDENILNVFAQKCIDLLKCSDYKTKKEHMSTQPRLKDIKRLLWCLSNLNYKGLEISDIKNVIIPSILQRVEQGDVDDNFFTLIEISLFLWMLNYRAFELLPYFLNKNIIESINKLNTPIKTRLNLLLTCMFYEEKKLLREIGYYPKTNVEYNMTTQLEKRPLLQKVISNLKDISKNHALNRFEVTCQVPGINIIGITGFKKNIYKSIYIEVLDDYTTLKNTENLPTGLMQLKLRLLEHSNEAVILVDSDEIGSMTDNEIQNVLLEEMEFVC